MVKYTLNFLFFVFLSILIAGLYGVIHDQITCTISPEYYAEFKFHQFGLYDEFDGLVPLRTGATIVGFMATWWVGIPVGVILGIIVLVLINKSPIKFFFKSILRVFLVAFLFGVLGYFLAGNVFTIPLKHIPESVQDIAAYERVGIIHIFSYLGGLCGLVIGVLYLIMKKRRSNNLKSNI